MAQGTPGDVVWHQQRPLIHSFSATMASTRFFKCTQLCQPQDLCTCGSLCLDVHFFFHLFQFLAHIILSVRPSPNILFNTETTHTYTHMYTYTPFSSCIFLCGICYQLTHPYFMYVFSIRLPWTRLYDLRGQGFRFTLLPRVSPAPKIIIGT